MAIGFARVEFVKRSAGKTACGKAAYNSRDKIAFEGNCALSPKTFDYSYREKPSYHEILLPKGVSQNFQIPEVLWNAAEAKERKINSQVAIDLVLALPDDKMITLEDRIALAKGFVQENLVVHGLAAQIDIHSPERQIQFTKANESLGITKGQTGVVLEREEEKYKIGIEKGGKLVKTITFNPNEFTAFNEKEHNWHAHVLVTTRRFKENGQEFEDRKARDILPQVRGGYVVAGPDWGKLWTQYQNHYFEKKGLSLRVESNGIIPQEHLGPLRLRARAFDLFEEHDRRQQLNVLESENPRKILEKITDKQSVFTRDDVDRFIQKYVSRDIVENVREAFWMQPELVQLVDKKTHQPIPRYTSQFVLKEERQIVRLADRIHSKSSLPVNLDQGTRRAFEKLTKEQAGAFQNIVQNNKLNCIQGYAGTGKSHLLAALKQTYEVNGYSVRAFGPDSATTNVLKEKGFYQSENIYRFLFATRHHKRKIAFGKEVWVLDEAGKVGNRPLLELLKIADKNNIKLVLSGDMAQLPSVDRGGLFKIFCEKFGSEILEDIQRQKVQEQRDVAKHLACGETGVALNKLGQSQAIKWSGTNREAIEALINHWAIDAKSSSYDSLLMIAHTNAEVRVLNELARLIRKERGEISNKEFACDTSQGKIYVSEGDRIEFRKNSREIGVTNGLSGVLLQAAQDRFIVSVKENDRNTKLISFNPQTYHAFQLGYTSTYYRSQGRTVDQAYVLHNPQMNKEMFYVGLTRHTKQAYYFVSKKEVYCLADLKRQLLKTSSKTSTLEYTTMQRLSETQELENKQAQINQLKDSEKLFDNIKGFGIQAWRSITSRTDEIIQDLQDKVPNNAFYNPQIPAVKVNATVEQVLTDTQKHTDDNSHKLEEKEISEGSMSPAHDKRLTPDQYLAKCIQNNPNCWKALNKDQQGRITSYFHFAEKASLLKEIADLSIHGESADSSPNTYVKNWKVACGKRNEQAYRLQEVLSTKEVHGFLEKKALEIVSSQSSRYSAILKDQATAPNYMLNLEQKLKDNLEPLLFKLFPDGPTGKNHSSFRFGSKGALSVVHSGTKTGQFYDFENKDGGSVFKLVQRELRLDPSEAKGWVQDFLGESKGTIVPQNFHKPIYHSETKSDWVSVKPGSNTAPKLEEMGSKSLHHYFEEVNRHAYRDDKGALLFYVLRLQSKDDPQKKITPPLSFGYRKDNPNELHWEIKGFAPESQQKRSLYNLHLLHQDPSAKILIVEGEKTADKAGEKFPEQSFVVMTWLGGAHAVKKTDWTPLAGREVIIWPDNDEAGFKAGKEICSELKKAGAAEIKMMEKPEFFKDFPRKWDLADPWPKSVSRFNIHSYFPGSRQDRLYHEVFASLGIKKESHIERASVRNILLHFEERTSVDFQEKLKQVSSDAEEKKIWKAHVGDAVALFSPQVKVQEQLSQDPLIAANGELSRAISHQAIIFEAKYGIVPSYSELIMMKETIREIGIIRYQDASIPMKIRDLAKDKMLTSACTQVILGKELNKKEVMLLHKEALSTAIYDKHLLERQNHLETMIQQRAEKDLEREKNLDKGM